MGNSHSTSPQPLLTDKDVLGQQHNTITAPRGFSHGLLSPLSWTKTISKTKTSIDSSSSENHAETSPSTDTRSIEKNKKTENTTDSPISIGGELRAQPIVHHSDGSYTLTLLYEPHKLKKNRKNSDSNQGSPRNSRSVTPTALPYNMIPDNISVPFSQNLLRQSSLPVEDLRRQKLYYHSACISPTNERLAVKSKENSQTSTPASMNRKISFAEFDEERANSYSEISNPASNTPTQTNHHLTPLQNQNLHPFLRKRHHSIDGSNNEEMVRSLSAPHTPIQKSNENLS